MSWKTRCAISLPGAPCKDPVVMPGDHLCKDSDEQQFNPHLDFSTWGITPQLHNRWKRNPDKAGVGERGKVLECIHRH